MTERPILFSGAMVHALLDGSKTQTRRIIKPDPGPYWNPVVGLYNQIVIKNGGYEAPGPEIFGASDENQGFKCPYGQPGDRLWVRETHRPVWGQTPGYLTGIDYRVDPREKWERLGDQTGAPLKWIPSIHMKREYSRILLEITGVRVERLQAIGEADARAEGVTIEDRHTVGYCAGEFLPPSIRAYRDLWESLNGAGSWDANPWVWVVEFKRVQP
jgi:hypothetical protein